MIYEDKFEKVEASKYLGHVVSNDGNDLWVVKVNLWKAQKSWIRL